jgi:hypothetical protein
MLPNKLTDFFDKPAWINRTLFYASIFLSIALIFIIVFGVFNFIFPNFTFPNNAIDYDNERYLLSALVQSLAATIALVITLSLVAVQLAAQSYSARVIDVYKQNPDMWILLCIYIFTIFYGLGLTKIIGLGILGNYMEGAIFVAYFMGFFAFVCLVPYMLKTLDLLKPSTVITLLAEDITKEKILDSLKDDGEIAEKDPVQPIIDMINGALERNDYETVRNGLTAIKYSTNTILENAIFEKNEESRISSHILRHVEKLGIQAAKKENEDSSLSIIKNLTSIGTKAVKLKHEHTAWITVDSLCEISKKIVENKLEGASWIAAEEIGNIGTNAVVQKMDDVVRRSVKALDIIGTKATEHRMDNASGFSVIALGNIGVKVVEQKTKYVLVDLTCALEKIAIKAIEHEPNSVIKHVVNVVESIGILTVEYKLDEDLQLFVRKIGMLGVKTTEANLVTSSIEIIEALEKIGIKAIGNNDKVAPKLVIASLREIGLKSTEKRLRTNTIRTLEALEITGTKAIEQNHENTANEAVKAIARIVFDLLTENQNDFNEQIEIESINSLYEVWKHSNDKNVQSTMLEIERKLQLFVGNGIFNGSEKTCLLASNALEEIQKRKNNH